MKELLLISLFVLLLSGNLAAQPPALPSLDSYLLQHDIPVEDAGEGLRIFHLAPGTGRQPQQGDYVLIHYRGMLTDSTVFDHSETNEPLIFQVGNREVIRGLDKGIRLLRNGGKAMLYIPAALGYQHYGVGTVVPPGADLIYEVALLDVMNFDQYDAYMRDLEDRERREFEAEEKEQFQRDLRFIEEYAVANKLKTRRTASGLSYCISKPGKGENARPGERMKILYEGYLADETLFEASAVPFEFVLGSRRVIEGWEEGLQFFNKGAEGWLLVPSRLGYGRLALNVNGASIPANSVLLFKIKVVEIGR